MKRFALAIIATTWTACNLFTAVTDTADVGELADLGAQLDAGGTDVAVGAPDASDAYSVPDVLKSPDTSPDALPDAPPDDGGAGVWCGNGVVEDTEECDEGSANSDEPGGLCRTNCSEPACGDGVVDSGEACDDGNFLSHDGCSSACLREFPTWSRVDVPLARRDHAVAYDSTRNVLVLFGGRDEAGTPLGDTWEFNGTSWSLKSPVNAPSARFDHQLAFEERDGSVILFGGNRGGSAYSDETWTWDGVDWTRLATTSQPPPMAQHTMVYSPAAGTVLLFGGNTGTLSDELYILQNNRWVPGFGTGPKPPARADHAMAVDGTVVRIHGGTDRVNTLSDTWEFDLFTFAWTEVGSATDPDLERHAMAHHAGDTYMFGGWENDSTEGELYRWSGTNWDTVAQSTFNPPPRSDFAAVTGAGGDIWVMGGLFSTQTLGDLWSFGAANWKLLHTPQLLAVDDASVTYDATLGATVVFAGDDAASEFLRETWEFSSSTRTWRHVPQVTRPDAYGGTLIFDPVLGTSILFGGRSVGQPPTDHTWRYDGAWTRLPDPSPRPEPREGMRMAYAPDRGDILAVGGEALSTDFVDTWSYANLTWQRLSNVNPFSTDEAASAYDENRSRMVVYAPDAAVAETFEFDGSNWQSLDQSLSRRNQAGMTYNPDTQRIVLFGGRDSVTNAWRDETYEWDGGSWTQVSVAATPAGRNGHAMVWDPRLRAIVMAGGIGDGGHLSDTWLFRYESATPDEVCAATSADEDGDGLTGCDDPDCARHPDCP